MPPLADSLRDLSQHCRLGTIDAEHVARCLDAYAEEADRIEEHRSVLLKHSTILHDDLTKTLANLYELGEIISKRDPRPIDGSPAGERGIPCAQPGAIRQDSSGCIYTVGE